MCRMYLSWFKTGFVLSWQHRRRDQCRAGLSVLWPSSHNDHEQCRLGGSNRCTATCADREGWQRFNSGEEMRWGGLAQTLDKHVQGPRWAAFRSIVGKWRRRMTGSVNLVKLYSCLLRCARSFRLTWHGFTAIWQGEFFKNCELTQQWICCSSVGFIITLILFCFCFHLFT